jgi:hypothetical protein
MELSAAMRTEDIQDADPIHRDTKQVMSTLLGEKEAEWAAAARSAPLNLLDLPVDVLKVIIREVSSPSWLLSFRSTYTTGDPYE